MESGLGHLESHEWCQKCINGPLCEVCFYGWILFGKGHLESALSHLESHEWCRKWVDCDDGKLVMVSQ